MSEVTPANAQSTSETTADVQATSALLNSEPSAESSRPLSVRYPTPRTPQEFVAQANDVLNRYLNGELPIEFVRVYAGLARVVSQGMSVEVARARLMKGLPDLRLTSEVIEGK